MISPYELFLKLLLGTVIGGIIGFERQAHGRPAGFRTQLLVCVACVLIMIISEGYYMQNLTNPAAIRIDPTRIAAGALTGIGFLGAGVILKTGSSIQGLTTAACIWIVAAIGLAIGAGQYLAASISSVVTIISLWFLRIVETRIPRMIYKHVSLVTDESGAEETVRAIFRDKGFEILRMDYEVDLHQKERSFSFTISGKDSVPVLPAIDALAALSSVRRVKVKS